MYACMCVCMYAYMCVCVRVCVYMCVYVSVCCFTSLQNLKVISGVVTVCTHGDFYNAAPMEKSDHRYHDPILVNVRQHYPDMNKSMPYPINDEF